MVGPIFEVVTGQILLSHRQEFERLHRDVLLPMMAEAGITPHLLLVTELGQYGRFTDIYQYADLADYERRTDALLAHPRIALYYSQIAQCVHGSITVEIARPFDYARHLTTGG